MGRVRGPVDLGARARGDDDRARRRRRRALLPARAAAVRVAAATQRVRGRGRRADRRRARSSRSDPTCAFEGMLPVRRLRGDWWELNEEATMLVGTRSGGAIRLGDPVRVRVGAIDAPRGRVDLLPGLGRGLRDDGQGTQAQGSAGRRGDEPAGVVSLQPARAVRVRDRADRDRGQVAARGQGPAQGLLRGRSATARCG